MPDNHHSTFSVCEFNYTKCLVLVEPLNICLCMLISFSVSVHVAACVGIPVLFKTILYPIVCICFFMSILLNRDIWIAAIWELL